MMLEQSSRYAIFDSACKKLNVPPGGPGRSTWSRSIWQISSKNLARLRLTKRRLAS